MRRTVVSIVLVLVMSLVAGQRPGYLHHQHVVETVLPDVASVSLSVDSGKCVNEVRWMQFLALHACIEDLRLLLLAWWFTG
jgi:hypothetical protein